MELSFPGAKRPGSEKAREREGQGAKVPDSELARVLLTDSLQGVNWPGSEKARYRSNDVSRKDNIIIKDALFILLTNAVLW